MVIAAAPVEDLQASPEALRRTLASARLFRGWPVQALDELIAGSRVESWPVDSLILRHGEAARGLYVVLSGSVELSAESSDGRRLVIRYVGPGWPFGLLSVIDGQPMYHYCRVHEPARVLLIFREKLLGVLAERPALWRSIVQEVVERNRFILRQFSAQAFEPLRVRLVRAILILSESYGIQTRDGLSLEVRLAKDRLGELLGVSRQSVTKEVKRLEAEGLLSMRYGRIIVHDRARLESIVRNDAAPP